MGFARVVTVKVCPEGASKFTKFFCTSALLLLMLVSGALGQNPVQVENALPGTTAWQLTDPAIGHEIEGYASLTSVNVGGQISFYVRSTTSTYTMEIYRMGWYGGLGGRQVAGPISLTGYSQVIPTPDPTTGKIECNWINPVVFTVPSDWVSGVYLAKLTNFNGKQSYMIFVVRDDARAADFLFQTSVNTYQAYNNWGGKSFYLFNSTGGVASKNSFNRPYGAGGNPQAAYGLGAGEFLAPYGPSSETYPAAWEYPLVRFLERNGYDVAYTTDVDTHQNGANLLNHKAMLITGHAEYWTWQMRDNVTTARDSGVSLAFLSANSIYWQVRYEPSATGQPDRTLVGYKSATDPVQSNLTTTTWRNLGYGEDALAGVLYLTDPVDANVRVINTGHWAYAGTGLSVGDQLTGLLGYEVDAYANNAVLNGQPNIVQLSHSPFNGSSFADSTLYTAASGATVFATGSMQWNWGLDDFGAPTYRPSRLSTAAQQITANILNRFLQPVTPMALPIRVNAGGPGFVDSAGNTWSGDIGLTGIAIGRTASSTKSISNTTMPNLYQTNRWGNSFSYRFNVANGSYKVKLKFAETFYTGSGNRKFNVSINGTQVLTNFDIVAAAGGSARAVDKTFPVSVAAGKILIDFSKGTTDSPQVSGIEITQDTGISVQVTPPAVSLYETQSQQFSATVQNTGNQSVVWSMSPSIGTLSASGLYTAPNSVTSVQTVTITATSVADSAAAGTAVVTLTPTPGTFAPIRVNAGGPNYTDPSGNLWAADNGFTGGNTQVVTNTIANTTTQPLYQSNRWGNNFSYNFSVPNGTYDVLLKFADDFYNFPQNRVFDVFLNGTKVLANFDIVASAGGGFRAVDRVFTVAVTNNQVNLLFAQGTVDSPQVNAIQITPASGNIAVTVSPFSANLNQSQAQQFTATVTGTPNTAVTWSLSPAVGTLSTSGLYTAPASISSTQVVTVTATSVADPTISSSATVTLNPVTVSVSPGSASLNQGQAQQFTATVGGSANTSVTWSISPSVGTVSSSGLYTAPATVSSGQSVTVTATSVANPAVSASSTVTLVPVVVSVAPGSVSLGQSQTQQFSATVTGSTNTSVTWTISPSVGTVSSSGLYTAPASITSNQTVTVRATSVANPAVSSTATVTLNPPITVSVTPGSASLGGGQSQQFTATVTGTGNTAVTWTMSPSVGTLSSSGLYTAPATVNSTQTVTITATSDANPSSNASATVTLVPVTVSVSPGSVSRQQSQTQQFTATVTGTGNTAVTWTMSPSVGTLSGSGLYTAPASITSGQTVTVTATSVANPAVSSSASVTLVPVTLSVTPATATLGQSQTQQFTATVGGSSNTSVTWTLSPNVGTISAGGLYTAPATITSSQTVTVTATSAANSAVTASSTVTLNPPVVVTVVPNAATLLASQTQQFTATVTGSGNAAVTWTLSPSVGTISAAGLYTAPSTIASTQNVTVRATSVADPTSSATAIVTLTPPAAGFTPIRVNVGGNAYSDPSGNLWSADTGFTGGNTYSVATAIANTTTQPLYQSNRYGSFSYNFAVPNGTYQVLLKFAEVYYTRVGDRIFDVNINGTPALTAFDMVAAAGGANRAVDVPFTVTVSGGNINIQFVNGPADSPQVNAIQIVQLSTASVSVSPSTVSLNASQSQQFTATVTGSSNTSVTWTMAPSIGTLSSSGLYTAPSSITTNQTVVVTATSVANPDSSSSATVTLNPPSGTFAPVLINSGGNKYTDTTGRVWIKDANFSGGQTASVTSAISNTPDPTLYKTNRYGASTYTLTVPNGTYTVNLKFAETYYNSANQRRFNVTINGTVVLTNFDIFTAAGAANRAVDRAFTVNVTTGQLVIQFTNGSVDLAQINAIEVIKIN